MTSLNMKNHFEEVLLLKNDKSVTMVKGGEETSMKNPMMSELNMNNIWYAAFP